MILAVTQISRPPITLKQPKWLRARKHACRQKQHRQNNVWPRNASFVYVLSTLCQFSGPQSKIISKDNVCWKANGKARGDEMKLSIRRVVWKDHFASAGPKLWHSLSITLRSAASYNRSTKIENTFISTVILFT